MPKATPQTTVEAVMFAVRQRGLVALEEAANVERLHGCDGAARAQINQRIARLLEQKGSSNIRDYVGEALGRAIRRSKSATSKAKVNGGDHRSLDDNSG